MDRCSQLLLVAVFAIAPTSLHAQDAMVNAAPNEALVGPIVVTQTVQGVAVSVPVSAFFSVSTHDGVAHIGVRVLADLSDLQAKIGAIIDTAPLPTNVCEHFGIDNVVARIWGKRLDLNGTSVMLTLQGDAENWTCAKNPVPCTTCGWELKDLAFGVKTNVWGCHAYECNPPLENRNLNQPFVASLPASLSVPDEHTIAIALGEPDVNLGGALGGVTQHVLRIAGVDLNSKAQTALSQVVDPRLLQASLPPEFMALNPRITKASFGSNAGHLIANAELTASAMGAGITGFIKALLAKPH